MEVPDTTMGIQGNTGQCVSAANFFLAPVKAEDPRDLLPAGATARRGPQASALGTPYKKEATMAQGAQGPVDGESEEDSNAAEEPGTSVTAADQAAMRILADNESI